MRKFLAIFILSLAGFAFSVNAQGIKDIRINEILVKNVDNYMDDYGHRSSWIELYNTGHAKINIGGCFLKAVTNDGKEIFYQIPSGDSKTVIGPLGYSVFFCEGTGTKGTFYTNFTLDNVKSIALLTAGKSPVDEVNIDYANQRDDISIGWLMKANGETAFTSLPQTTPNATNDTEPVVAKSERFRQMDPKGGMLALMAVSVVLTVLASLFIFFKLFGMYMVAMGNRKNVKATKKARALGAAEGKSYKNPHSGDEIAAIAMALQMFKDELHDKESTVITINRVARAYSPWSSKIYGLGQFNKK